MSIVPKTDRSSQTTVAVSSAGPFLLGFRLYDVDGILVYVNGIQRADWTLSADFADGVATDASITFSSPLAISDEIIIDASLAPWRAEDLVNGDGNLVQKLNVELGRVWSSLSEIRRDAMRAVRGFAAIPPVGDVDLLNIAQAETYANEAAASAASAAADAALAQSAQENLYDNYAGAWQNTTNYTRGQWVQDGGSSYLCIANHTSLSALNRPGLGSGWASYWALFAAKGNPGTGTGDVVATNAGSEYVSVAGAFRNNISAMLRAITKRSGLNLATDTTIDSTIYNSDGTNTNGPSGNADGDSFVSSKIDNSTYNFLWFGNARAWLGRRVADANSWVELATKPYVDTYLGLAQFTSRFASGTNGASFPTGSAAALEITNTDHAGLGVTLASNQITFTNAGTYLVEAIAPFANASGATRNAQISLYNVTQAAEAARGQSSRVANNVAHNLMLSAAITVDAGDIIELRGIANGVNALNGNAASLGQEVFNIVRITRLG